MGAVNVTVRIEEETKREFDAFCENVGMNITTAFNLFIRATLRTRELPFPITDLEPTKQSRETLMARGMEVLKEAQEQARASGLSDMSLDDVNVIIAEARREKQEQG